MLAVLSMPVTVIMGLLSDQEITVVRQGSMTSTVKVVVATFETLEAIVPVRVAVRVTVVEPIA